MADNTLLFDKYRLTNLYFHMAAASAMSFYTFREHFPSPELQGGVLKRGTEKRFNIFVHIY